MDSSSVQLLDTTNLRELMVNMSKHSPRNSPRHSLRNSPRHSPRTSYHHLYLESNIENDVPAEDDSVEDDSVHDDSVDTLQKKEVYA